MIKIASAFCVFACLLLTPFSSSLATLHDPLRGLAARIARAGTIDDPVQVAQILRDTIGATLVRANDYFGRSDAAAGQMRFALDDRATLSQKGVEVSLLIRIDANPGAQRRRQANAAFGRTQAELDISDWGAVSPQSWTQSTETLGGLYPSVVLPDTPGLPSFELPAAAGCRLMMTVAPRHDGSPRIWFIHITQYEIPRKD